MGLLSRAQQWWRILVPLRDSILWEAQPSCCSAEAPDCVSSFMRCCIFFLGGVSSPICPYWVALDECSAIVLICLWYLLHLFLSLWHLVHAAISLWPRAERGPEGPEEAQCFTRGRKIECSEPRHALAYFLEEDMVGGLLPG